MMGTDSAEVSGVAIQASRTVARSGPGANSTAAKTRQYLAEKILNLIQTFYTEGRIIRSQRTTPSAFWSSTQDSRRRHYQQPDAGRVRRDHIYRTTGRQLDETRFAETLSLRQAGVAIPDDAIVATAICRRRKSWPSASGDDGSGATYPEQAQVFHSSSK